MENNIRFKIEFYVQKDSEKIRHQTKAYFEQNGFKLISEKEGLLKFERGSFLLNAVTFNPLKWKSQIIVSYKKGTIGADFKISTAFQAVTNKEKKLWERFVSNYRNTIETGNSYLAINKDELKKTKKSSWGYVKHTIIGAIIFGIPGGVVAYMTGYDIIVSMSAASGGLFFLMNKISSEKE